jgi:hypothetical protein
VVVMLACNFGFLFVAVLTSVRYLAAVLPVCTACVREQHDFEVHCYALPAWGWGQPCAVGEAGCRLAGTSCVRVHGPGRTAG